jgi:hypothetical protein
MSNINAEEIRGLLIPLPDLATQDDLLVALDKGRAARDGKRREASRVILGLETLVMSRVGLELPADDQRPVWRATGAQAL